MKKGEFISAIKAKTGNTVAETEAFLDAFWAVVEDAMVAGDDINLVGIGAFKSKVKPARTGINPKTKETIKIEAKKVAEFKFAKAMTAKLN